MKSAKWQTIHVYCCSHFAQSLTNKDVEDMHSAGLSDGIIIEKIKSSGCTFDTSPSVLVHLKALGVSEPLILAMMQCTTAAPSVGATPVMAVPDPTPMPPNSQGAYTMAYVKSDRKWGSGAFHEPYNKISEYFEGQLTEVLDKKGVHQKPIIESGECCRVTLELLEVSNRVASFHKVGVDENVIRVLATGRTR
jgi:hypothetical protein